MSNEDLTTSRRVAADLIEQVINEKIPAEAAIEQWPRHTDEDIDLALHALMHFRDDAEIHSDDEQYEAHQLNQLKEIAAALVSDSANISQETRGKLKSWRFW